MDKNADFFYYTLLHISVALQDNRDNTTTNIVILDLIILECNNYK